MTPPRESDLLAHIYQRSAALAGSRGVAVGPGDDCAVIETPAGDTLLLTVDQLIAGVHFDAHAEPDAIARKAVARSISDIAAMGGTCWVSSVTAALPTGYTHAEQLFDRVHTHALAFGCPAIGGDIATTTGPLTLTVTVLGKPHPRRGPVLRSGARPGDHLFVTGQLGGSLPSGRHLTFEPRIVAGAALCDNLGQDLHAMLDLSDGLGRDADRLAVASGVVIEIDATAVPRHPSVADWRSALADGEDYELCFACAPNAEPADALGAAGTMCTRVGRVLAAGADEPHARVVDPAGDRIRSRAMGFEHGQRTEKLPKARTGDA